MEAHARSPRSEFLRMTERGAPVHDLDEIIERTCITDTAATTVGTLTVRYPESCKQTIPAVMDLLVNGLEQLVELIEPLTVRVDSTVVILDNRQLPGNIRYRRNTNARVVLAPFGCDSVDWWQHDHISDQLVDTFFHETVHIVVAGKLPGRTPRWLQEGLAEYVAHRIAQALVTSPDRDVSSGPPMARFLAAKPATLRSPFSGVRSYHTSVEGTPELYDAYELYLGAFLVSERLGDGVRGALLEIVESEASEREKLKAVRKLDPIELHHSAQGLRQQLIAEAERHLGGNAEEAALATLGWLGVCVDAVHGPPATDECQADYSVLASYYASCLPRDRDALEAAIRNAASCGPLIRPGWGTMIDGLCERFPEASSLVEDLQKTSSFEVKRHLARCRRG